jgi:hypothetical protein
MTTPRASTPSTGATKAPALAPPTDEAGGIECTGTFSDGFSRVHRLLAPAVEPALPG